MDDLPFSMVGKVRCSKCSVSFSDTCAKCPLCGTPKSLDDAAVRAQEIAKKEDEQIMKLLYNLISKLHINQKKQLVRIIEDKF